MSFINLPQQYWGDGKPVIKTKLDMWDIRDIQKQNKDNNTNNEKLKNNIKIDKSYNDKKPSYMKDDLIKIAINKNIIGATRFTIPLLEESLIKSLEGNTLREKALKNKLNVDNDVNDRGLTIALMEFLTGKLK